MTIIYKTTFTKIGNFAHDALNDNMLITFKQNAPADLEDYCFLHNPSELSDALQVGDIAEFDGVEYPITAIGSVASDNLSALGHITFRFDGATEAEFPGSVHVVGVPPKTLMESSILVIKRD
ncbi:PTS glucitol/sorbitol transporter subunit IIA [Histophilus somni]|uniref:PTS glucitol/sorbitol transporter subunit IIA n=1 Tax=Histophilus somni TaxID=731 RepID=A0A9Q6KA07_HISSO|nr:PTS glucitol/sorbitol transporter subunit IIA [Histophilus somni]ACA30802.1 PTS system glucitol/sorbitol-specific IIA component [Histophilus somni 2336]ARU65100.1 PTS glucitol/sorbitol transporter subunit IIA [Histophilus somni]ARU66965.1 PTS glucitol/sorbitol transporter subunit IIA [Histophilus somni]ARU68836.1 PTS glucitol/sorbitol transporter subunit IIA [Histophilus somni]ARU70718.1 PTS glucitol/sorbitol transporter subunit IIA [Histophilus somni]